jgi:hypothetical protein
METTLAACKENGATTSGLIVGDVRPVQIEGRLGVRRLDDCADQPVLIGLEPHRPRNAEPALELVDSVGLGHVASSSRAAPLNRLG